MISLICWLAAAAVVSLLIWYVPVYLNHVAGRQAMLARMCDEFYEHAEAVVMDASVPKPIVELLEKMSRDLGNPKYVRKILWSAVTGKVARHAQHPPQSVRKILKLVRGLSEERQLQLSMAIASSMLASATNARLLGVVFMRVMLPSPPKQQDWATFLGAEQYGYRDADLAAA